VSKDDWGRHAAEVGHREPVAVPIVGDHVADDVLEFVRFCYRRRRVGWPELYDEMCAVAAREAFRGMGYEDLAARGIRFCLSDLCRSPANEGRQARICRRAISPSICRSASTYRSISMRSSFASGTYRCTCCWSM
jgi:hypothetical protein